MARALGVFCLSLMLITVLAWAGDASLPDPTQPPESVMQAASGTDAVPAAMTLLQTVILRQGARPAAIIGGELVSLGERYGEARLMSVSEDSVVLEGSGGRQVLYLMPGIHKTPAKAKKRVPGGRP
jgi:MSHA biogenesis protein MshK